VRVRGKERERQGGREARRARESDSEREREREREREKTEKEREREREREREGERARSNKSTIINVTTTRDFLKSALFSKVCAFLYSRRYPQIRAARLQEADSSMSCDFLKPSMTHGIIRDMTRASTCWH
jgi:hypothetical protein